MSQRMTVDDWRAMIDETEAQSNAEPNAVYQACAETARRANEKLDFLKSAAKRSDAEPSQDMRDRLAIYLMALGECNGNEDPEAHVTFFTKYLSEQRGSEHSGDCKKQPWTCCRCVCDEHLTKADYLIAAFSALAQSDADPDPTKVICPNCAHQFGAISVADQERLRAQSDAEPEWNCAIQGCKNADTIEGLAGCAVKYRAKIKELEAALTQSNAEPVAWQWRMLNEDWPELSCGKAHAEYMLDKGAEIRPVFAAPPHPDASAGLIEAAKIAEAIAENGADEDESQPPAYYSGFVYGAEAVAKAIRARAADRSGK